MDFLSVREITNKKETIVYPEFHVIRSQDLMVRGKAFYAVWDAENDIWSTDEYVLIKMVDAELNRYADYLENRMDVRPTIRYLANFNNGFWSKFKNYLSTMQDNYHELDSKLTFLNSDIKKTDYASKRLPYDLSNGSTEAYDELMSLLYEPDERDKIEWAIGSIFAGDSISIQKFLVLYGEAGTGKSTVLNIIQQLFSGYYTTFDSKALGSAASSFSTEVFRGNPLVAIQHDGDMSKIDDNSRLNSIIAHEEMTLNEKYKATYTARINAFLFLGTNKPVKISDSRSGLIRRLIDVHPTGERHSAEKYQALMSQIKFEIGAIGMHCLELYRLLGRHYYDAYIPLEMMYQTDEMFNYVDEYFDKFVTQPYITLAQAWAWYKEYSNESGSEGRMQKRTFREQLKPYFQAYHNRLRLPNGDRPRNVFEGFKANKMEQGRLIRASELGTPSIVLDSTESLLDTMLGQSLAQYSNEHGVPTQKWADVKTRLKDLDTRKEHYVRLPENHIVIDFDLKGADGEKSAERNLQEASKWPRTYAEYSRGGAGVHLHYIYTGDVETLAREYADGIEIKVFTGLASLRRRLSFCNTIPVAEISDGLPQRERPMINQESIQSEKGLRKLIERNLRKEIHPGTKPSIDFIFKILDDAYADGLKYDVTDMRPAIMAFANNSTNQASYCVKLVNKMRFKSEEPSEVSAPDSNEPIVFYDVEVFPNLFVIVWKPEGDDTFVHMINPSPTEVEDLMKRKLVGFNNRRYDNHILYGRMMGYSNEELYNLSQGIINNSRNANFAEAYGISYADVYDFSSEKKSLKKFEIELGLHHKELNLPWDQPVDESMWEEVAKYCENDVAATEAVFHARKGDFLAREILAELSGLSVTDGTTKHAAKIIFGNERNPQKDFVYTDLSTEFPGYNYSHGTSKYRDETVGEGGYVYAEPGYYEDVVVLDVASMHPTSIEQLNLFGPYTKNFSDIKQARIHIKHLELDEAAKMLDGKLAPYLTDNDSLSQLAYALKIVINSVYGLTAAHFDNPFRDERNVDNIVAKRGALFMIDLKHFVQEKGFTVAHIKTDSIKIPGATPEIIDEVMAFGRKYGYIFEIEERYKRMTLVNDAVYIALNDGGGWSAVGAQFQHPYVYKALFSKEELTHNDYGETKAVQKGEIFLDFDESLTNDEHNYIFVGKVGRFVPVKEGCNGGVAFRFNDDKYYALAGTKGYRWKEYEIVENLDLWDELDQSYFDKLAQDAIDTLNEFGGYDRLVKG